MECFFYLLDCWAILFQSSYYLGVYTTMSEDKLRAKIVLLKKPIIKKQSSFIGGNTFGPKKMIPNKDAYKRQ